MSIDRPTGQTPANGQKRTSGSPVDGCRNTMLITELQGVDASQNLGELTTGRGGVLESQANLLAGIDDEDGSDGEGNTLFVNVGQILLVEHVLRSSVR